MRTLQRLLVGAVVAVVAVGLSAPPAAAHTVDGSGPTNYLTEITAVSPDVEGLRLRVLEFGGQLELVNDTGEEVLILGYQGEPYLRITDDGVFENRLSPATYLNADRQAQTEVPDEAQNSDADTPPDWQRKADGSTAVWHDHRVHWMGNDPPEAVQRDDGRAHVILPEWTVPLRVGDRSVNVEGTLRWVPGPQPWAWLAAAIVAAAIVVLLSLRWWRVTLAAVAVVLVVGDIAHAAGLAWAPDTPGNSLARFVGGGFLPLIGWAAGAFGVWGLARGKVEGAYGAAMAGFAVLLIGGVLDFSALTSSQVAFVWGETPARAAVAGSIGLGVGAVAGSLLLLRRTFGSFLGPKPTKASPDDRRAFGFPATPDA